MKSSLRAAFCVSGQSESRLCRAGAGRGAGAELCCISSGVR